MEDGQEKFNNSINPWSWNKIANMIYMESPAGVGYSYKDIEDPKPHYDEVSCAEDNYLSLVEWFNKFPEF